MKVSKLMLSTIILGILLIAASSSASAFSCRDSVACDLGDSGECYIDAIVDSGRGAARNSYWEDYNLELQAYPSLYTGYSGSYEAQLFAEDVETSTSGDSKTVTQYFKLPSALGSLTDAIRVDLLSELEVTGYEGGSRPAFKAAYEGISGVELRYAVSNVRNDRDFAYSTVPSLDEQFQEEGDRRFSNSQSGILVIDNELDSGEELADFKVATDESGEEIADREELYLIVTYTRPLYAEDDFTIDNTIYLSKKNFETPGTIEMYFEDEKVGSFDNSDYLRTDDNKLYEKSFDSPQLGSYIRSHPDCGFNYDNITNAFNTQRCNVSIGFESQSDVTVLIDGDNKRWQPFSYPELWPSGLSSDSDGIAYPAGSCPDNAFDGQNPITGAVVGEDGVKTDASTIAIYALIAVVVAGAITVVVRNATKK